MKVNIVNIGCVESGPFKGLLHRGEGAVSFRMRRGHMVSVAALPVAKQFGALLVIEGFLQQCEPSGLADVDAVAFLIPGTAGLRRYQIKGVEAVEGGQAERIYAAYNRCVTNSGCDIAMCGGENLGAG